MSLLHIFPFAKCPLPTFTSENARCSRLLIPSKEKTGSLGMEGEKVIFILSQDFPYKGGDGGLCKRCIGNSLNLFQLSDILFTVGFINFFKKLFLCHDCNLSMQEQKGN